MLRNVLFVLGLLLTSGAYAIETTYLSGKIDLKTVQEESSPGILVLPVGKIVSGKVHIYHQTKNDVHMINGNAEFKNSSGKIAYVVYYVSLKDKKGNLVAASNGDFEIGTSGNIHEFVSALMPIPVAQIEQITNYEVVVYESDTRIGGVVKTVSTP